MSRLCVRDTTPITYIDRRQLLRSQQSESVFRAAQQSLQDRSCTLYVGNLSLFTRETQIWAHFAPFGHVRDVVMGLSDGRGSTAGIIGSSSSIIMASPRSDDRTTEVEVEVKAPCGFCFVVFEERSAAVAAQHALHKSLLDDRMIHVGWDVGLATVVAPQQAATAVSRGSPDAVAAADAVTAALSRRWGRGAHGGQVVDSVRQNLDDGRGGLGVLRKASLGLTIDSSSSAAAGAAVASSESMPITQMVAAATLRRRHGAAAGSVVLRALWNACNALEGEGLDMSYYWVEGKPRKSNPNPNSHKSKNSRRGGVGGSGRRLGGHDGQGQRTKKAGVPYPVKNGG